jgi:hypothetical protein
MKNVHLIPTDKPSRLSILNSGKLNFGAEIMSSSNSKPQNIYITSDEEIKERDWFHLDMSHSGTLPDEIHQMGSDGWSKTGGIHFCEGNSWVDNCKKIILTTDPKLINDGVQTIDDEFLEWFVKNPSCEFVELDVDLSKHNGQFQTKYGWKIIIPKEEPKQTVEEYEQKGLEKYSYELEPKQLFTDYPITELGDEEFKEAPIRQCELLSYDDNKYCYVKVEGIQKEIKRCYIYLQRGKYGEVDCISIDEINKLIKLPKEEPKQETFEDLLNTSIQIVGSNSVVTIKEFLVKNKWKQERMYSEEDMTEYAIYIVFNNLITPKQWFEQFKKK